MKEELQTHFELAIAADIFHLYYFRGTPLRSEVKVIEHSEHGAQEKKGYFPYKNFLSALK